MFLASICDRNLRQIMRSPLTGECPGVRMCLVGSTGQSVPVATRSSSARWLAVSSYFVGSVTGSVSAYDTER